MFSQAICDSAKAHALKQFPNESVGIVIDNRYLALSNIHTTPSTDFVVDSREYESYLKAGQIQAVIHSHTKKTTDLVPYAYPSQSDMETQRDWGIPFGIIYTDGERCNRDIVWLGDTVPRLPLVGRPFIHGTQDCYSLIRDYYHDRLGIWIKDFPRSWNWWNKGERLYDVGFAKAGFIKIREDELQEGDGVLFAYTAQTLREQNPCHAGIYLGDEKLLHHRCTGSPYDASCLSSKQLITRMRKFIIHCVRYVGEK